jgi:hypothetical protein
MFRILFNVVDLESATFIFLDIISLSYSFSFLISDSLYINGYSIISFLISYSEAYLAFILTFNEGAA